MVSSVKCFLSKSGVLVLSSFVSTLSDSSLVSSGSPRGSLESSLANFVLLGLSLSSSSSSSPDAVNRENLYLYYAKEMQAVKHSNKSLTM